MCEKDMDYYKRYGMPCPPEKPSFRQLVEQCLAEMKAIRAELKKLNG